MNINRVYISYADSDVKWLQRLRAALLVLQRRGIEIWDRSQVPAGRVWQEEIDRAIANARVALILLSADYFASSFNLAIELPALLKARRQGVVLIPVLVRPCFYEEFPEIASLLPLNAQPLSTFDSAAIELALDQLTRQIAQTVASAPTPSPGGSAAPAAAEPSAQRERLPPTRGSLRQLINAVLVTDSDFDAFCLDHFIDVYRQLSRGMDRVTKVNVLLEHKDPADVLERLQQDSPAKTERFKHLLFFAKEPSR